MTATLLVIHILLAISLIGVILIQRASADGGGLMGGGGNMGGMMSVRGTANLLTRITSIIAGCFIATSILLTIIAGSHHQARSLADEIKPIQTEQKAPEQTSSPASAGTTDKPAAPAPTPAVPVSQ